MPNKLVRKFETDAQGCFRLKFSNRGKYLAAACTLDKMNQNDDTEKSSTIIKIFDVETESDSDKLKMILKGHNDLIHDLCWDREDKYLVSASADGTVRIWNLTVKDHTTPERFNFRDNDHMFYLGECFHPSFVYGAKIHPSSDQNTLYIVTVCFDGFVRIWEADVDVDHLDEIDEPVCKQMKNICDKPQYKIGKLPEDLADKANLEDDALRQLMNPQDYEKTKDDSMDTGRSS